MAARAKHERAVHRQLTADAAHAKFMDKRSLH